MGFNIYERAGEASGDADAAELFRRHAREDGLLRPGSAWKNLCEALARRQPGLEALRLPAMQGRAWELFDAQHHGAITEADFAQGLDALLRADGAQAAALTRQLRQAAVGRGSADFSGVRSVAIIGGGVAGLQTANLLRKSGYGVTIFEKSGDVGGVWRENYADFGLQVPRELYQFPGFPWPKDKTWEKFPKGAQVQEYILRYAEAFDLKSLCKFKTSVLQLSPSASARGWVVEYLEEGEAAAKTENFDFVVVATGMYSTTPHFPVAPGASDFAGQVMHSSSFVDAQQAAGKKVLVVGGGKSAVDCAVVGAKAGVASTLLTRAAHWPVPRYLLNLVPFKWGTYSRFGHSTLQAHHKEPACFSWLHSTCAPMKWIWWRTVEVMFRAQFRLSGSQVPSSPIEHDVFTGGQILNYEFRDMLRANKAGYQVGEIDRFEKDGLVLRDGSRLQADLVVYATGFAKSYDMFDASVVQPFLEEQKDGLYLYRNMIPPRLQDIAFIGSEVSTYNNILTHGLQAEWLRRVLAGEVKLPSSVSMQAEVDGEAAWKRSWMPASSARASLWQLHMMKYHDSLCMDMGVPHKRKGLNVVSEVFAPYTAADYAELFAF